MTAAAPRDDIVRAITEPAVLRSTSDGDGRTLHGHFAVFNQWTEIDSTREGHFMERLAPGSFTRSIVDADRIKVLYDHGKDPQLGNKPLGKIISLEEDERGVRYEVQLLKAWDTDAPWLMEAAREGLLGASFRFSVESEDWAAPRMATRDNPERLKERTITGVKVREFGPVTFPAYAGATAMVRSATDEYFDSLHDPLFVARLTADRGLAFVEHLLATEPVGDRPAREIERDPELLARIARALEAQQVTDPPAAVRIEPSPVEGEQRSEGTAGGQPEPTPIPTDLASRQIRARQIEAYRMGLGKGY